MALNKETPKSGIDLVSLSVAMSWEDMRDFDKKEGNPDECNKKNSKNSAGWYAEEASRLAKLYGDVLRITVENNIIDYMCEICFIHSNSKSSLENHCKSLKHLKKKKAHELKDVSAGEKKDLEPQPNKLPTPKTVSNSMEISKPANCPPREKSRKKYPRDDIAPSRGSRFSSGNYDRPFEINYDDPRGFYNDRRKNGLRSRSPPRTESSRRRSRRRSKSPPRIESSRRISRSPPFIPPLIPPRRESSRRRSRSPPRTESSRRRSRSPPRTESSRRRFRSPPRTESFRRRSRSPPRTESPRSSPRTESSRSPPRSESSRRRPDDRYIPHQYDNSERRRPKPRYKPRPEPRYEPTPDLDILLGRFRQPEAFHNIDSMPVRAPSPPKVDLRQHSHSDSLSQLANLSILSDGDAKTGISVVSNVLKSLRCYYQIKSDWELVDLLIDAELKMGSVSAVEATKHFKAGRVSNVKSSYSVLSRC